MDSAVTPGAWLLMVAGENRLHGGNLGYNDQIDAYYSWDSNVPNHKNLREGDIVALWDKQYLYGISVIERIKTKLGYKLLNRCPQCQTTRIGRPRVKHQHSYRCTKCHHEFLAPQTEYVEVTQYQARYDAAWTSMEGLFTEQEIRSLALNPGEINAMRPLNWAAFSSLLIEKRTGAELKRVAARADIGQVTSAGHAVEISHGFNHALVRVRRGQRQFRERLLGVQGNLCAFTGSAPAQVLEAGHLYSYAKLGTHFEYGGLMLRRDIHRLFDDGMLAVEPSQLRIDVAPALAAYPQYAQLHAEPLRLSLHETQIEWLEKHWEEHRITAAGPSLTT